MAVDGHHMHGEVDVRTFDVDQLRALFPGWDTLADEEKLARIRRAEPDPIQHESTTNVTCVGFHEAIVDYLNPNTAITAGQIEASHLAIGTSGGSGTVSSDTALNTEVFRTTVDSYTDNGTTLDTATVIGSGDANGNSIDEVGLFTAPSGGILINHTAINSIAKDSSKTITFEVNLTSSN